MNPYYDPKSLGLEMIAFDEPDLSYEYNTLCFWATEDGRVYSASDSGCSCPTPFEVHDKETVDEVLNTLEREGSVEQAVRTFDAWNKGYDKPHLGIDERRNCEQWVKAKLRS